MSYLISLGLALLLAVAAAASEAPSENYPSEDVRILYLTDCTKYSDWQTVGMAFSFKMSGQPGKITRVMCCNPEEKARYDRTLLALMDSHIAKSYAYNEKTKDHYAAFNKPGAVVDFFEHFPNPAEDFFLVLDSDMYLRIPFSPSQYSVKPGWCISADYTYMIGCANDLAKIHIPEIGIRNDTLGGPTGRRCDMVGGFFFMHREDLAKMCPKWLSITEDVREDPESWRLSGDQYVEKGGKPWISEMYGYSFAAAKAGIWHRWDTTAMHYPTYVPSGIPKLMHYGLLFNIGDYKFDKHWHYDFDVTKCPPWDLRDPKRRTAGVFEHPPRPSTLKTRDPITVYYRDLLSIETVATLNAGFCDYHLRNCPPSKQMLDECTIAWDIYKEVTEEARRVEKEIDCKDFHPKCKEWQDSGECEKNPSFMGESCKKSCKVCSPSRPMSELQKPYSEIEANLKKLRETLGEGSQAKSETAELHVPKTDGASDAKNQLPIVPHIEQQPSGNAGGGSGGGESSSDNTALTALKEQEAARKMAAEELAKQEAARDARKKKEGEHKARANSGKSPVKRELVLRCYRMTSLSVEEVKKCVTEAKEGREYKAAKAPSTTTAEGNLSEEDLHFAGRDLEDLTLTSSPVVQPSDSDIVHPSHHHSGRSSREGGGKTSRLSNMQAVALWLVVVALLLVATPRIMRMRKRPRSGMRSE